MSKRRTKYANRTAVAPSVGGEALSPMPPSAVGRTGGNLREWVIRVFLVLLSPLLFVALIELVLRIGGYGLPTSFFVKRASGTEFITNQKFACQFAGPTTSLRPFLFTLPVTKQSGVLRICVLGESAAMGTPDPAFSFNRILEAQLHTVYPDRKFEIINAAMRGVDSHAIRKICREFSGKQIDVFVVYMGNNEFVGQHGAYPGSPVWTQSLSFIRLAQWMKSMRFGQLFVNLLSSDKPPEKQEMDYFRAHRVREDDPRVEKVRANFRANLRDICDAATELGGKLLLCTVAVNLRDCPPLGSLHRSNLTAAEQVEWSNACEQGTRLEAAAQPREALLRYEVAARVDDQYAELHFRIGRCHDALRQGAEAKKHYELARDRDALKFRTDSGLNEIVRSEAKARENKGVILVDSENELGSKDTAEGGIPGRGLFYEHVHPTFTGNYELARLAFKHLVSVMGSVIDPPASVPFPTQQECADYVGYTPYDDVNVLAAMVRLTSGPPFLDQLDHGSRQAALEVESKRRLAGFNQAAAAQSIATYEKVLMRQPHFWPSRHNLALLLLELRRTSEAVEQYRHLVDQFPEFPRFRLDLGGALLRSGNKSAALAQFRLASQLDPLDKEVQSILAQMNRN